MKPPPVGTALPPVQRGQVWTARVLAHRPVGAAAHGKTRRPVILLGWSEKHEGRVVVAPLTVRVAQATIDPPIYIPHGTDSGLTSTNVVRGDAHAIPVEDLHHHLGRVSPTLVDMISAEIGRIRLARLARGEHPGRAPEAEEVTR